MRSTHTSACTEPWFLGWQVTSTARSLGRWWIQGKHLSFDSSQVTEHRWQSNQEEGLHAKQLRSESPTDAKEDLDVSDSGNSAINLEWVYSNTVINRSSEKAKGNCGSPTRTAILLIHTGQWVLSKLTVTETLFNEIASPGRKNRPVCW